MLSSTSETPTAAPALPFQYAEEKGFFGELALEGYLEIKQTEEVQEAWFAIVRSDNERIFDFLAQYQGNSYVGERRIGIGCYEEAQKWIRSENAGDDGMRESIIAGAELALLAESAPNVPVRLLLEKPVLSSGSGAPACYSHFRSFKVMTLY